MYSTLVEAVIAHGNEEKIKDKIAVAFRNDSISYKELCRRMKAFAYTLSDTYKIKAGDRVMFSAVSRIDYVVALLGIQYLGAISIPIEKNAMPENILNVFKFNNTKLLLVDTLVDVDNRVSLSELYKNAVELADSEEFDEKHVDYVAPDKKENVAEQLLTTGTTGTPKGAMLTFKSIYASIHNTWHGTGMREDDVVLIPLPLNHSVGMRVLRTTLYIGASVIIQNGFRFAKELQTNIEQYNCTALVGVPASIIMVMNQMKDEFSRIMGVLRYIEFGAGSLSYSMKKKLVELLPNTTIINTWGSTETGGAIFLNVTENPDKYTSIGKPVEGIEIKVVNQDGEEIEAKDQESAGRMALRGDMQMAGYYNLPEENEKTLIGGWLYTSDMVYIDDDGYVYMLGRADSIINVGGKKVSPVEVENIAQEFSGIVECACIGVDDPEEILGFVPVLYVVGENGMVDVAGLKKHLSKRMEDYKIPHYYVQINEVPRNRMQKIDYKAVRNLWNENGPNDLVNPILYNILNRRSIRKFTDEKISKPVMEMLIRAGIAAPSGKNMQSWKFTVIQDADKIKAFGELVGKVSKEKKVFFFGFNNPVALILVSNTSKNPNEIQDSACAVENILLAAKSFGLGGVWLNPLKTISNEPEIREMLNSYNIPEDHTVWSSIALGYPAEVPGPTSKKTDVVEWF